MRLPLRAATVAAAAAAAAYGVASRLPDRARAPFTRTNFHGRDVTLLEGPAYVLGAAAGAAAAGHWPGVVAAAGAGAFGALDDLAGDSSSKGLRGHLTAAAKGQVTTGFVKIVGLGATGALSAGLQAHGKRHRGTGLVGRALLGGAVVAGSANLLNLLDLRPGRALKATLLLGAPVAAAPPAAAAVGAALPLLAPDLRGEAMLGDTGANAAGALLGLALADRLGPRGQAIALAAVTALTLASEKVSFTRVIESTPVLRELDRLGRG